MWLDDQRTALYRLYGEGGALLYIGITNDPTARFEQHAGDKEWWPSVNRHTVEWFEDRPSAAKAEADAIRAEDPAHNWTYSPRYDRRTARDIVLPSGVREVSIANARKILGDVVGRTQHGGSPTILVNRKKRVAALISMDFYDAASENERIVNALCEADPALYAKLTAAS
jgi:prevent-host-death family protein